MHHFYPSGLQPIDRSVVFVVDVSKSVGRRNLEEIQAALNDLLQELRPADLFNVVAYSNAVDYWNNRSLVPATAVNVRSAKSFVDSLSPSAGLNMSF